MLYILFPVYNEQKNLRRLIRNIFQEDSSENIRIIAVNDGSDDSSMAILQEELRPSDVICTKLINMNVGAAFSDGIQAFLSIGNENDVLVLMETDLTSDVSFLKVLEKNIRVHDQDVVIASRYQSGGCYRNFPILRRILSYSVNRLLRVLFPIEIDDLIKDNKYFSSSSAYSFMDAGVAFINIKNILCMFDMQVTSPSALIILLPYWSQIFKKVSCLSGAFNLRSMQAGHGMRLVG